MGLEPWGSGGEGGIWAGTDFLAVEYSRGKKKRKRKKEEKRRGRSKTVT